MRVDPWRQVKTQVVENESSSSKWPSMIKFVRGTKHFFGIDQTDETNGGSGGVHQSNDSSNRSQTKRSSPIYQNKALTNWNERTFRVLKSNAVFGGKLKETALDRYIENIDDTPDESNQGNAFLYYKSTGESLDLRKRTALTDIAMDGVRKAFKVNIFAIFLLSRIPEILGFSCKIRKRLTFEILNL